MWERSPPIDVQDEISCPPILPLSSNWLGLQILNLAMTVQVRLVAHIINNKK